MKQKSLKQRLIEFAFFIAPFLLMNFFLQFVFKMNVDSIWTMILSAMVAYFIADFFVAKMRKKIKKKKNDDLSY